MNLNDLGTLWGNPIVKLREYAKKYRIGSIFLYTLDIAIMAGMSVIMYKQHSSFKVYMFVMVMFVIIFSLVFSLYLNSDRWSAFKFYRKHKNDVVEVKKYKVDEKRLYTVLYCMNYKRLKTDKDYKDYIEMIASACNEDWTFSKSFMKYVSKYEDAETGNLEIYVVTKGKKSYFIDYKETGEDLVKSVVTDTKTDEEVKEDNSENTEETTNTPNETEETTEEKAEVENTETTEEEN